MVAGSLAKAGYFMGERLWDASIANPKGYFEDVEVNGINEQLLEPLVPKRPKLLGRWFFRNRPKESQRWLADLPLSTQVTASEAIQKRIQSVLQEPYCFKDPRFCYTLPVWRPFLRDAVFVCVFRSPAETVNSILKLLRTGKYLRDMRLRVDQAIGIWLQMYLHVIEIHRHQGKWLFLHYEQARREIGLRRLADFTGAQTDNSFPDEQLRRSQATFSVPRQVESVYSKLCELAEYNVNDAESLAHD
jgi:hypothetical protein